MLALILGQHFLFPISTRVDYFYIYLPIVIFYSLARTKSTFYSSLPWGTQVHLQLHTGRMTISFDAGLLDGFVEWKMMGVRDYVLGLEPTNCYIMGRHDERENGTLPVLKAFESVTNTVQITFTEE